MDIADQAEVQESMQREAAIKQACLNTGPKLQHIGECHFCDAEIAAPKLFCDGKCATRYELKKER